MLCLSMSTSIIISITWGYFLLLPRASTFWATILLDVFRREDSVNAHQRCNTLKPNWKTPPLLTSFFLFKGADSDPSLVLNILEGRKTTSALKEKTVAFKDQFILGLIHLNARTTRFFKNSIISYHRRIYREKACSTGSTDLYSEIRE